MYPLKRRAKSRSIRENDSKNITICTEKDNVYHNNAQNKLKRRNQTVTQKVQNTKTTSYFNPAKKYAKLCSKYENKEKNQRTYVCKKNNNNSQIPILKIKLSDRPQGQNKSNFYTSINVNRTSFFRKDSCHFSPKNNAKNIWTESNKHNICYYKKSNVAVEIEVFMPLIDAEKIVIINPKGENLALKVRSLQNIDLDAEKTFEKTNFNNISSLNAAIYEKLKDKLHINNIDSGQETDDKISVKKSAMDKRFEEKFESSSKIDDESTISLKVSQREINILEKEMYEKPNVTCSATRKKSMLKVSSDVLLDKESLSLEQGKTDGRFKSTAGTAVNVVRDNNSNDLTVENIRNNWNTDENSTKRYEAKRSKVEKRLLENLQSQLYIDHFSLHRDLDSTFHKSLPSLRREERDWRKTTKTRSLSRDVRPNKSNRRRNVNNEDLTLETWIERSKYLQSKNHCSKTNDRTNHWRTK